MKDKPAFPCIEIKTEFGRTEEYKVYRTGMTLRDYFAAKAIAGVGFEIWSNGDNHASEYARRAYQLADALLKQREVKGEQPTQPSNPSPCLFSGGFSGLFGGGSMTITERLNALPEPEKSDVKAIFDEILILQKKASAWDRVVSITNDGTFLTSDMVKEIERQEIK